MLSPPKLSGGVRGWLMWDHIHLNSHLNLWFVLGLCLAMNPSHMYKILIINA